MKRRSFLKFFGLAPAAPLVAHIPAVQATVAKVAAPAVAAVVVREYDYMECTVSCAVSIENPARWSNSLTDFEGK